MRTWPALVVESLDLHDAADTEERLAALVDDLGVAAIEDLADIPIPAGGLWDPTDPPLPEWPSSPLHWRIFFGTPDDRDRARAVIAAGLPALRLTTEDVPDGNWAARAQRALTAVRAGRYIVAPPWDPPDQPGNAHVVIIEPSMGFGTGHHPTTRLCLQALSAIDVRDQRVIDLGTGSGVLAIAAALAGAREVVGLDLDADAVRSADASAARNVLRVKPVFLVADFRDETLEPADLVLANLTGGMLTRAAARLCALVLPAGGLVVSGFDLSEEAAVREALGHWPHERRFEEEGWVAFALAKNE
jgi:ribosomal protein L11 methyltransferase